MYLFLRRIDSRPWGDRLMQLLEVDQSVDHPYEILRSVQARVSHPVFRPKLNVNLYVRQDQVSHIKRQK